MGERGRSLTRPAQSKPREDVANERALFAAAETETPRPMSCPKTDSKVEHNGQAPLRVDAKAVVESEDSVVLSPINCSFPKQYQPFLGSHLFSLFKSSVNRPVFSN